MSEFHTDGAILGTDESPDKLNRTVFAEYIADVMLTLPKDSGFVLSLEAPWGHGKTSVLNLIQKRFKEKEVKNQPIVCKFNPWMMGSAETLVQNLLVQLAASIELPDHVEDGKKAAKALLTYSEMFSVLKFVPGTEPWATLIKGVFEAVGKSTEKIADLKKLDIEKRRDEVVEALRDLDQQIVIIVDDIDRLPPKEVFEIVRLVKAVADFPCVVYILCYDPSYVEASLKSAQIEEPGLYLDKIVQMKLSLPVISGDDLEALFEQEYDALPREENVFPNMAERLNKLWYRGLREILETPRDIKRLFNRVRFVEPGCRGNVNRADLLALQAIALKANKVYQHLCKKTEAYIGVDIHRQFALNDPKAIISQNETERGKALAEAPVHYQDAVQKLLQELFPQLDNAGSFHHGYAATQGLIRLPDRLKIALSGGLPSQEVSYTDAIEFLSSNSHRSELLENILEKNLFPRFIHQLRIAADRTRVDNLESLIAQVGKVLDSPNDSIRQPKDSMGIFGITVTDSAKYLIIELLKKEDEPQRLSILQNLFENPKALTLSTSLVYDLCKRERTSEEQILTDSSQIDQLKVTWLETLKSIIQSAEILNLAESREIFLVLTLLNPDVLIRSIDTLIDSDEKFDKYIMAIAPRGISSNKGAFVHFGKGSSLENYGGEQRLKRRAEERLKDSLVQGELRFILSALLSRRQTYLSDGSEDI